MNEIDKQQFPMPEHTITMECPLITVEEVSKAIKYLKSNTPIGSDGIKILQSILQRISTHLNQSF
jgi:hypothetical protein